MIAFGEWCENVPVKTKRDSYDKLREVSQRMFRSLCMYIDRDLRNDDWYEATKAVNDYHFLMGADK